MELIMEEFEKTVAAIKAESLAESDLVFLADTLRCFLWSEETHKLLKEAVDLYRKGRAAFGVLDHPFSNEGDV
jgi:hypothetical protein